MFETLKNVFRVKEMRRKLLYLIWMIFVIRIGCQIPVPGVDSDFFKQWFSSNAEAIVIGGGVSKAGQPLIDCIQKYYEKYAFTACKKTPIILATLGNDAGIYGSARMVIKEV